MSCSLGLSDESLTFGLATPEGTVAYRDRFADLTAEGHFRVYQDLCVSSIGMGTYLGDENDETDRLYRESVALCLNLGCNVIDTAVNYRCQRSEQAIGESLREVFAEGEVCREEIVVTTKGGFIPFDREQPSNQEEFLNYIRNTFLDPGIVQKEDIVAGCHCMSPAYIQHQLDVSRKNLGLSGLDVYYIHNPETQLQEIPREKFISRLRAAFEVLEKNVGDGKIHYYGTATWAGYRQKPDEQEYLSLEEIVNIAEDVAGENHHFKSIQLPLNLGMPEAVSMANQPVNGTMTSLVNAAHEFDISLMASASIFQGRVAQNLPDFVGDAFPGLQSDAQRALQFVRSTPGMTVALVGMRQSIHVDENLALTNVPPASVEDYQKLFKPPED